MFKVALFKMVKEWRQPQPPAAGQVVYKFCLITCG